MIVGRGRYDYLEFSDVIYLKDIFLELKEKYGEGKVIYKFKCYFKGIFERENGML